MGRYMQRAILLPPSRRGCYHSQAPLDALLVGLLDGLSASDRLSSKQGCREGLPMFKPCLAYTCLPFKHLWIYMLDMSGFKTEEIKLKVDGNAMYVHARHEDVDGEDVDIVERKRVVKIPECVDVKKMSCYIDRRGKMIIKAPFSWEKVTESATEKCGQDENVEAPRTESKTEENIQPESINNENNPHEYPHDTESINLFQRTDKETVDDSLEKETINHEVEDDYQQSNVNGDFHFAIDKTNLEDYLVKNGTDRCDSPVHLEKDLDDACGEFIKVSVETLQNTEESSMDTMDVVEMDGQKYLSAKLETQNIFVDSIRVHCKDKVLSVHAKCRCDEAGKNEMKEFHRRYKLPVDACDDQAKAFISDSGYLAINVPIIEKSTDIN